MTGRSYRAIREGNNRHSVVIVEGVKMSPLPQRQGLINHSPDGFAWGYGGSGASQLALAMCADALGDDRKAVRIYQAFKNAFVALQTGDEWEVSADEVRAIVQRLGQTG